MFRSPYYKHCCSNINLADKSSYRVILFKWLMKHNTGCSAESGRTQPKSFSFISCCNWVKAESIEDRIFAISIMASSAAQRKVDFGRWKCSLKKERWLHGHDKPVSNETWAARSFGDTKVPKTDKDLALSFWTYGLKEETLSYNIQISEHRFDNLHHQRKTKKTFQIVSVTYWIFKTT